VQASYPHSSKGLTASLNYTLAHSLDNATAEPSGDMSGSGYGTVVSKSNTLDYGNSGFDIRHHITSQDSYSFPFGEHGSTMKKLLEGGLVFNAMVIWGTGLPFTVLNDIDTSNTNPGAGGGDRTNVTGNPYLSSGKGPKEFFNTAAFTQQAPGTLGDERRNQLYGPHSRHLDASLFKNFTIFGETSLQFRTECFNVTNTSNFSNPQGTLNGANFGQLTQITTGYSRREIQFALRIQF
jgi:hypothetical protein